MSQDIEKCIAASPDTEWKVIIALARYAGLRTPSETFAIRWQDIDFARGEMVVRSSKTEHHTGGGVRRVPIFRELEPHLLALHAEAEPGQEHVIVKRRIGSANLRTTFEMIIARAGLIPWPRLFHNLRGSRETELLREYGLAAACKWIGNTPEVAARHYAMVVNMDADFAKATGRTQAQGKAQVQPAKTTHNASQRENHGAGKTPKNTTDCDGL